MSQSVKAPYGYRVVVGAAGTGGNGGTHGRHDRGHGGWNISEMLRRVRVRIENGGDGDAKSV